MCVCVCVYLAKVWVSLSVNLYMLLLLFFGFGAAGRQLWRRLLYRLCRTQRATLSPREDLLMLPCSCSALFYPLVFQHFADVDCGLGVLPEVPLLLEQEALSALPAQV